MTPSYAVNPCNNRNNKLYLQCRTKGLQGLIQCTESEQGEGREKGERGRSEGGGGKEGKQE